MAKATHTHEDAVEALKPLGTDRSSRAVLNALEAMIDAAGLRIGDRLPPEVEIARKLEISRAKVREALVAWQNMGIVTRNKKAGTRLAAEVTANAIQIPLSVKIEAESLLRTHAVRRPLEIETVRHAARNVTEQQGRVILARAAELMSVAEAGEDWRPADHRFHAALQDASGNPLFGQLVQQIQQAFHAIYAAPFGQPELGQGTLPLHPDLARAVVAGDEARAATLMADILDMVEAEIRNVMEGKDA